MNLLDEVDKIKKDGYSETNAEAKLCQSEVVHSMIAVLCFVPVLATFIWGTFWVFFITSVLAAGVESMFVIMQRYNRPRVIKMIEKEKSTR